MSRAFVRENITLVAIIIFFILFGLTYYYQSGFLYKPDGSIRQFGIGYRSKTIMPVWLFAIILGILSYLAVLYYLTYPNLNFV